MLKYRATDVIFISNNYFINPKYSSFLWREVEADVTNREKLISRTLKVKGVNL